VSGIASHAVTNLQERPTHLIDKNKMTTLKCLSCGKIIKQDYLKKKVRCPYCGYKILYKPRTINTKVPAI